MDGGCGCRAPDHERQRPDHGNRAAFRAVPLRGGRAARWLYHGIAADRVCHRVIHAGPYRNGYGREHEESRAWQGGAHQGRCGRRIGETVGCGVQVGGTRGRRHVVRPDRARGALDRCERVDHGRGPGCELLPLRGDGGPCRLRAGRYSPRVRHRCLGARAHRGESHGRERERAAARQGRADQGRRRRRVRKAFWCRVQAGSPAARWLLGDRGGFCKPHLG